jgi:flagellin-like protein
MYKREEAVSPVIGVILMVAITVILAAVIAAFVFGMTGNVQKTKSVAATAEQQGADKIMITNHGGKDARDLVAMYVNGTISNGTKYDVAGYSVPIYTGGTVVIPGTSEKDHVVVTGFWTDGSSQVVLDTNI